VQEYKFTDRGKFLISIVFIVALLIVLALTFVAWGLSRNSTPDGSLHNPQGIHQNDVDPSASGAVTGDAHDGAQAAGGVNGSGLSPGDSVFFDADSGTITFPFTPSTQSALDESAFSMIGEFVASPLYTDNTIIAIAIPHLPDEGEAVSLTTAVIDALTTFEVPKSSIVFFVYQPEPGAQTFEVTLSFHS